MLFRSGGTSIGTSIPLTSDNKFPDFIPVNYYMVGGSNSSTQFIFTNGLFANVLTRTYGKTAAIDKNTVKFAFFSSAVASGSQLLVAKERTNLYLKFFT